MKRFLNNEKLSDLTVTCGPDTYKVHKIVVCTRSEYFAKAVHFPIGQEAKEDTIDLPEDEPAIVKLLIQYLYEGEYEPHMLEIVDKRKRHTCNSRPGYNCDYTSQWAKFCPHHQCGSQCNYNCQDFVCDKCAPPPPSTIKASAEQLLTHSKMYETGDKYFVSGLKNLSRHKFEIARTQHWDDPKFAEAAHHAFSTTPDEDKGLRDIVRKTISNHMILLKKPKVEALLTHFNGLAFGLLKQKAEASGWLK